MDKFFLVQIKRTNNVTDKGVVVKDFYDDACQSYHAYLALTHSGRMQTPIMYWSTSSTPMVWDSRVKYGQKLKSPQE